MDIFLQIIFNSLEAGGITALATMGVILIFRTSSAFNYAQGVISMFCAFAAAHMLHNTGMNVFMATGFGLLVAIAVGVVIDIVIISRTRNMRSISKQIITLGLVIVLLGLAPMFFGVNNLTFERLAPSTTITILGANTSVSAIVNVLIGLGIMAALFFIIQRTKWGLAVRATASNGLVARMMGIPTPVITMAAWAIAAALGTMAALMHAPMAMVSPTMMDSIQITALLACVLGGLGTFHGPVIAAYLIIFARSILTFYVSSVWAESIVFLLILVALIFAPNGLFGKKVVKKV